jgi:hypothetical protein
MAKRIRELGPLAVATAVLGVVIVVLLSNGNNLGNWLLAAFLVGHGWIHLMYVMPRPKASAATAGGPPWPFDLDHSWLAAGGAGLHVFGLLLVAVTVVGYFLAGLATITIVISADLWPMLVLGSTAASALLMALFYNPGLLIGHAIDVALIAAVIFGDWRPA